jgi:hypothetical protein
MLDRGLSKGGGSADSVRDALASSINRAKEAVGAASSDATDAGSDALKALQSDWSDLKETVAKLMSRASDETAKSAREVAGQVSTAASDIAERGANVASVAADQAKTFHGIGEYCTSQPAWRSRGGGGCRRSDRHDGAAQLLLFGIDIPARMAEVRIDLRERFDLARNNVQQAAQTRASDALR